MRVTGRAAVVTGASSGIGAATARLLAARGARVALVARHAATLEPLAAEIGAAGGEAAAFPADLADLGAAGRVAADIERSLGATDILVNNAGSGRWLAVEETDPGEAAAAIAVPYLAAFAMTRALLPGMLARNRGHVVNLTSAVAFLMVPGAAAYGVARWAMRAFTAALRMDVHGTRIGVTLVAPGKVATPYFTHNPGSEARIPRITRLYRTLSAEEVAGAIVRAIEAGRRTVILPPMLRLTVAFHRFAPGLVERVVVATGWHRPATPPR